ncbi:MULTISPECIES: hypothetical protein [unclassified Sphingomonas]|uniref:hypothetical protein n=1 Tax=unclassified Sphingomonas TaxID=196159 RepID=UPI00226A2CCD|nr:MULTISPECIES: hypothetical protein [unclassified Sphingomonas]
MATDLQAVPIDPADLARIAASYPPEAAQTPRAEREAYFTEIQRRAWDQRFNFAGAADDVGRG